jgi:WD40 repeat protein
MAEGRQIHNKNGHQKITSAKYQGHQGSVLCLDVSSSSSLSSSSPLLLSGSEDRTARLWDLREHDRRRACLCIQTSGDVLSAVFAPPRPFAAADTQDSQSDVPSLTSPFARDHIIYLGVENIVLEYDLRNAKAPILQRDTASRNLGVVLQHQDEVNQISLAYHRHCCHHDISRSAGGKKNQRKGGKRGGKKNSNNNKNINNSNKVDNNEEVASLLYLAACDDAGTVRCMVVGDDNSKINLDNSTNSYQTMTAAETTANATTTILHHDSNSVAVVPACAFRPNLGRSDKRNGVLELASGGTDCKIHLWDISRPK